VAVRGNRTKEDKVHILVIDRTDDYGPPDLHGPFESITEAQGYAAKWRSLNNLPVEATPENNEEWTNAGWYFGIFEPTRFDTPS
jgi:hypothetical protein